MTPGNPGLPSDTCREVGDILARVGDKWAVFIIMRLGDGAMRFSELQKSIPTVSKKMLTTTLRGLERDGYLTRMVTPTIPPRVDYELTDTGRDVMIPINALAAWAMSRRERIEAARRAYDARCAA